VTALIAFGALRLFAIGCFLLLSAHRAGRHPPAAHAAAVGPAVRLHCGARHAVVPHNSLRALARAAFAQMRQVRSRSALRAPTARLCQGQEALAFARHKQSSGLFVSGLSSSSPSKSPLVCLISVFILFIKWWWSAVELVGEGGCGGQRKALSTASPPVRRQPHRPQIHGAEPLGSVVLRVHAQPVAPKSLRARPSAFRRACSCVCRQARTVTRTNFA
jgi:hypothetical protein